MNSNNNRLSQAGLRSTRFLTVVLLVFLPLLAGCDLVTSLLSREAEGNFPMRSAEGSGVMNCKGEWVLEPVNRDIGLVTGPMVDGWAPLMNIEGDYFNFINKNGDVLNTIKFDQVMPFREGLAAVRVNDEWGFVNTDGEYAIRPKFVGLTIGYFNDGLANVGIEANTFGIPVKWIYINEKGEEVLGPYDYAGPFSDGYAQISIRAEGEKSAFGYIDRSGEFVLEFSPEDLLQPSGLYTEGLFPVVDHQRQLQEGLCSHGFMSKNGEWVIEPQFCRIGTFHDGLMPVVTSEEMPEQWGYIDTSGELVIPVQYDLADNFSGGCARVLWDNFNGIGIIDTNGDLIYEFEN